MKLYDINQEILDCIDMETGEIIVPEMLDALEMEKSDKVENIALWIKDLNAEAAAIKAEKDNLARRQKSCENKAASLKQYLTQSLGGQKFKTARVVISWRKSSAVEIMDASKIPAEYHIPQPDKIDKLAIKDALKTGEVAGAQLVEHSSIQIK